MPPAQPGPAQIPIRPIIINKPVERIIERPYSEGYRGENEPQRHTGPIQQIVLPPMEQRPERPSIVNVASPTSPSVERIIHEPVRSPERTPQKERDRDRPVAQPIHPGTHEPTRSAGIPPSEVPPVDAITPAPNQKPEVQPDGSSEVRKKDPPASEEKPSGRKKPEVKASEPPEVQDDDTTSGRKRRTYNGKGGRIHTEAQIDELLDFYLMTGELPIYVSDRQRYDYRHHIRLPERKEILAQRGISVKN